MKKEILAYRYWTIKGYDPFSETNDGWTTNSKGKVINTYMIDDMKLICNKYNINLDCLNKIISIASDRKIKKSFGTLEI